MPHAVAARFWTLLAQMAFVVLLKIENYSKILPKTTPSHPGFYQYAPSPSCADLLSSPYTKGKSTIPLYTRPTLAFGHHHQKIKAKENSKPSGHVKKFEKKSWKFFTQKVVAKWSQTFQNIEKTTEKIFFAKEKNSVQAIRSRQKKNLKIFFTQKVVAKWSQTFQNLQKTTQKRCKKFSFFNFFFSAKKSQEKVHESQKISKKGSPNWAQSSKNLEKTTPNGPKRSKNLEKTTRKRCKKKFLGFGFFFLKFFDFSQRQISQCFRIEKNFIKIGCSESPQRKNWTYVRKNRS